MRWYQGNIAEAVTVSKTKGTVFVVYIEGKDEKSKEFTSLIENEEVSTQLESNHFVAIKVEENSVPHQQFTQIYKQASVPSLFFIGKSGSPLEVVTDVLHKAVFLQQLQEILQRHGVLTTPASSSQDLVDQEKIVTQEAPTANSLPSSTSEPVVNHQSDELTPEQKIERAQELISQKRLEKQAEEEGQSRVKEIERRKLGQDVQKLKRWQQDQELKDLMEERNKEKQEQIQARQRVLAQIAQDKAERAAKFSNSPTSSTQPTVQQAVQNSNTARLQFRCPDGSAHTHEFSSNCTLGSVRDFIKENLNLPYQSFTLSITFPRREFTAANNNDTLVELQLVPNAVILILPLQDGTVSTQNGSWMAMFWSFIAPILNFLGYLKQKLFGGDAGTSGQRRNKDSNVQHESGSVNQHETSRMQRRKLGESSVVRRQGNVHRLQDNQESDDDNNTWNGNSTQQM
ncbi:hypothetical protein PPYR_01152 [Photinus pyralis]|uniref:UBX domain-containing protein 4 n=1 Tax=Photinus pyralis TaxID=7054 RepID=A0A1Y1KIC9_PHOPY|nr:UBX domain-containing protein 4-like [Photinus pyralis]XP_031327858.1 UBX domain-containing protein 4-like [Photinus pyralis]XP_031327926.1 UBX domain-containing protein 4-like [Photinus pyralis]KAB0803757.1 hypothetical protein PPYR_00727 [Photinus pyralis]KAB0803982.1 hypothetical protein PPYR_00952 [Photinus pyralis]KAB0804182.1 hypothetical protein PPYR_01152 [Photinus pyralis]